MQHTLIDLPYSYQSLEPHMDAQTVEIHYSKHHQGYVNKLNEALEKHPELFELSLEDLLKDLSKIPQDILTAVVNNAGGTYNHNLYWNCMSPNAGGEATGELKEAIDQKFGSFDKFKEQLSSAAATQFASGWAWLSLDKNNELAIQSTKGHETPLSQGIKPILVVDVWEHAYYLKHQNKRPDFISTWWNLVNWDTVNTNFLNAKS